MLKALEWTRIERDSVRPRSTVSNDAILSLDILRLDSYPLDQSSPTNVINRPQKTQMTSLLIFSGWPNIRNKPRATYRDRRNTNSEIIIGLAVEQRFSFLLEYQCEFGLSR